VAHAAVLCPSFWKATVVTNPGWWERTAAKLRGWIIAKMQRRHERALAARAF
jgi:indolepyruvate ferredoxin oxidoreductase alpha subunit